MNIKQLAYFVGIVEAGFNLSVASVQLNISQPALSTLIKRMEREENTQFFYRQSGRLSALTRSGEILYQYAQVIIAQYEEMRSAIQVSAKEYKGPLRIGIPPMSLSMSFAGILSKLITDYPMVKVDVVELGAHELRKALIADKLDFAVLITPSGVDESIATHYSLQRATMAAFMHESHPLASQQTIDWTDLGTYPLAIFDETFMIHHQLIARFEQEGIRPNIQIKSAYWDYMLMATHNSQFITILPSPVSQVISQQGTVKREFTQPFSWEVVLCHRKKVAYSQVEQDALASLISDLRLFDKVL